MAARPRSTFAESLSQISGNVAHGCALFGDDVEQCSPLHAHNGDQIETSCEIPSPQCEASTFHVARGTFGGIEEKQRQREKGKSGEMLCACVNHN